MVSGVKKIEITPDTTHFTPDTSSNCTYKTKRNLDNPFTQHLI